MKVHFLPQSKIGIWANWLTVAMIVLFIAGTIFVNVYESAPIGNTLWEDIGNRPGLAISMLSAMSAGVASFICGLIAIFLKKDRSILVIISALIGLFVTFMLVGELLFGD